MKLPLPSVVLLTLAVVFALLSAGLVFGWGFWIFDNREWRQHSTAWLGLSLAAGWASCHPLIAALDEAITRRRA